MRRNTSPLLARIALVCAIVFLISIPTVLLLKSAHGTGGTPEPVIE